MVNLITEENIRNVLKTVISKLDEAEMELGSPRMQYRHSMFVAKHLTHSKECTKRSKQYSQKLT